MNAPPRIAVLIPCYNEGLTIGRVVEDFRRALPEAQVHVFDNNSADDTATAARDAGATVHRVPIQGKGAVVREMFRLIDADIGVMVDGDATYPAERVRDLMAPVIEGRADMAVGTRLQDRADGSFRPLHVLGNQLVLQVINGLFGARLTDVLSGYRAFSWRFMKTTPILSRGFEIETEITLHALQHQLPVVEIPVAYGARPDGSESKLHTFRDGFRVLRTIGMLFKDYRPLLFFGALGVIAIALSLALGGVILNEWQSTGRVAPARAVLAASLGIAGGLGIAAGLILDTVNRRARELMVLLADHVVRPRD